MSDVYKQRKVVKTEDFGFDQAEMEKSNTTPPSPEPNQEGSSQENPLSNIQAMQDAMARETGRDAPTVVTDPNKMASTQPFAIEGNMPPEFRQALNNRINQVQGGAQDQAPLPPPVNHREDKLDDVLLEGTVKQKPQQAVPDTKVAAAQQSTELANVLAKIEKFSAYDELQLPSKSKFYDTIPPVIHVRPMTGEEENILATPRYVKKGQAIDMIFRNVIREDIDTTELLSIDRTYLLVFLRGISYTPEYDVEVRCPACEIKFTAPINLDLDVTMCPDDFGVDNLEGTLPRTGLKYKYRLATGDDEQAVTKHREMYAREFGAQREDDTLLYRSALLLEYIDEISDTTTLLHLLKKLPVEDVNYIRNMINEPPFGVDTDVEVICPNCSEEFEISLPLEANFFFPRKKTE